MRASVYTAALSRCDTICTALSEMLICGDCMDKFVLRDASRRLGSLQASQRPQNLARESASVVERKGERLQAALIAHNAASGCLNCISCLARIEEYSCYASALWH
jgi:hypothetical protein